MTEFSFFVWTIPVSFKIWVRNRLKFTSFLLINLLILRVVTPYFPCTSLRRNTAVTRLPESFRGRSSRCLFKPASRAAPHFRSCPEAACRAASLKIGAKCIFDGRRVQESYSSYNFQLVTTQISVSSSHKAIVRLQKTLEIVCELYGALLWYFSGLFGSLKALDPIQCNCINQNLWYGFYLKSYTAVCVLLGLCC